MWLESKGQPGEDKDNICAIEVGVHVPTRRQKEDEAQQQPKRSSGSSQEANQGPQSNGDFSIGDQATIERRMWQHNTQQYSPDWRTMGEGKYLSPDIPSSVRIEELGVGQLLYARIEKGHAEEET